MFPLSSKTSVSSLLIPPLVKTYKRIGSGMFR